MHQENPELRLNPDDSRIEALVKMENSSIEVSVAPSRLLDMNVGSMVKLDEEVSAHKTLITFDDKKEITQVVVDKTDKEEIRGEGRRFRVVHIGKVNSIQYQDRDSISTVVTENTGDLKFVIVSRRRGNSAANWAFLLP